MTRSSTVKLVAALAGAFREDSTVCLHLPNDVGNCESSSNLCRQLTHDQVTYPALVLAILASRCRWTGSNTAYTEHELEHHFRISDSRYVVTLPEHFRTVKAAIRPLAFAVEVILFTDLLECRSPRTLSNGCCSDVSKLRTLHDLLDSASSRPLQDRVAAISAADIAALASTSGTTGLPKMAARTHRAMILESSAIEDDNASKPYEIRRLFCTPIFHAFSMPEMVINALRLGYPTYFMRRFDETFAQKVHDFGITEIAAPPPMLRKLQQQVEAHHLLQTLRLVFSGGAPLAAEQRDQVTRLFNLPPRLVQVYGMTEGGWFTTFKYPEEDLTGSVGRPLLGVEIEMSSMGEMRLPDGRKAAALMVRSPHLMAGYFNNLSATEEVFTNGWLETGDIGYIEDGKVYVVDRAKDLIKVNAWQVAPTEIEAALATLPEILDAAAIGLGHGLDEHPAVFVVVKPGFSCTKADIIAHLLTHLARYKVGHLEVRFVDSVPRNPSGKILRKALRAKTAE